jgi:hypothetical protein
MKSGLWQRRKWMSREDDFDDFMDSPGDFDESSNASEPSLENEEEIIQILPPAAPEPEVETPPAPRRPAKKKKAVSKVQTKKRSAKPARKPA